MNKKWLWVGLALVATFVLLYRFWYQPKQAEKEDREKFEQIEETVSELISRAERKFPEATFKEQNYCYYQSRKFEDPNLACVVSYKISLGGIEPVDMFDSVVTQKDLVAEETNKNERINDFLGRFLLTVDSTPCTMTKDNNNSTYDIDCISDALKVRYELSE